MKKAGLILSSALITTLIAAPAFAGKHGDGNHKEKYKEHYKQHHQMHMDMMHMLSETMSILKSLNHMPSAKQQEKLGKMIEQLDDMMEMHSNKGGMMMKHKDKSHGKKMMDEDMDDDAMGKGKHHQHGME